MIVYQYLSMEQKYNAKQERHLVKGITLRKDDDSRNYELSFSLKGCN